MPSSGVTQTERKLLGYEVHRLPFGFFFCPIKVPDCSVFTKCKLTASFIMVSDVQVLYVAVILLRCEHTHIYEGRRNF